MANLTTALEDWSGEIESGPDGGLIEGSAITGGALDAVAADGLAIVDSELSGVGFVTDHRHPLDIRGSTLRDCDLSGAGIRSLRSATVIGSRLSGANLSDGTISDVVFEECILQYSNLGHLERTRSVRLPDHRRTGARTRLYAGAQRGGFDRTIRKLTSGTVATKPHAEEAPTVPRGPTRWSGRVPR